MSDPVELYEILTNHGKRIAQLEKELAELRRLQSSDKTGEET